MLALVSVVAAATGILIIFVFLDAVIKGSRRPVEKEESA